MKFNAGLIAKCLTAWVLTSTVIEAQADDAKVMQYRSVMEKCMSELLDEMQRASDIRPLVQTKLTAGMMTDKFFLPCQTVGRKLSNELNSETDRARVKEVNNDLYDWMIAKLMESSRGSPPRVR